MTTLSETRLSREIQDALTSIGLMVIRIQSGKVQVRRAWMQLAEPGTPDLHVVGLDLWLEVKLPGQRPSKIQEQWHARARRAGASVEVVHSVGEAIEVARLLREALERKYA